jgi:hypothetical protein
MKPGRKSMIVYKFTVTSLILRKNFAILHRRSGGVRAAKLDVNWWVIHRRLFGNAENQELVDALTRLYEEVYGAESEKFREAAYQRAMGMLCSDLWVNQDKPVGSPLLVQEEESLYLGYKALKEAINS